MPELVGFQTVVILDPYGMTFDAVGVFGLVFWLLFKSGSSYCAPNHGKIQIPLHKSMSTKYPIDSAV